MIIIITRRRRRDAVLTAAQLVAKQTLFLFMPCHFLFDIAVYFVQKEKGVEKIFIKSPF